MIITIVTKSELNKNNYRFIYKYNIEYYLQHLEQGILIINFATQIIISGLSIFYLRRPLIVTCLDNSKAFDSIKETLNHYIVHYKISEANIYKDDYTEIQFGDIRKKKEITTVIRQGCTGSTIFFLIVTYMIMAELDKRGT